MQATLAPCEGNDGGRDRVKTHVHSEEQFMPDSQYRYPSLPPDDPKRLLTVAQPNEDQSLLHLGIVGDTYTMLVSGAQTDGRFCLFDMQIPPNGGPGPHRHDFEETFVVLDGEIEATFRGRKQSIKAGETINIPSNAPHQFHNRSSAPVRLLCMCSPAGQENFFMELGVKVNTRTAPPPKLNQEEQKAFAQKAASIALRYRTEMLDHA